MTVAVADCLMHRRSNLRRSGLAVCSGMLIFWTLLCPALGQEVVPPVPPTAEQQPAVEAEKSPEVEKPADTAAEDAPAKKGTPVVSYLTVNSPVDDTVFRHVRNTALQLQEQALRENRPALLFLEIRPGQSEFHQVYGLAQFLTSAKVDRVTTVAWIPETVTGNNVLLALGCREIVMHPDALLGDVGRGKAVDVSEEQSILSLVERRHNLQVNRDVALGMINPAVTLLQVSIERDDVTEKRIVTEEQAKVLRENQIAISDVEVIKDKGKPGLFSGQQAREIGLIVTHTASQQAELADLYRIDPQSLNEVIATEAASLVRLIDVTQIIDPVLEAFLERQIDRAIKDGAQVLIFRIKSPGGYLMSGTNLATRIAELDQRKIRTIAWIPEQALSSAAIAALGCDEIYIGPEGQIGDAGVIRQQFDGAFERVPEKIISPLLQTLKSLAKRKHRPAAILEAMTLKDLEVFEVTHRETGRIWFMSQAELDESQGWVKGPLVAESKEGLLLTLQGKRAVDVKVAAGVVKDLEELKDRLNIPADIELNPVGRTWVDSLVFLLNDPFVTGFLFFIAIICIYIELHFMIGLFGICSALCFGIFFWSRYFGGTATGLEMVLFLIGITCLLLEFLVIPGFGVFGITGALLVLASLVLAMETFDNLEPAVNSQKLVQALSMIGLPILAVIVSSMFLGKYLPRIPLLRNMILTPPLARHAGDTDEFQLRPDLVNHSSGGIHVGQQGKSLTVLRPSGKARFGTQIIDVVTQGPFLQANVVIEVTEARGNRVVVRSLEDETSMA